MGVHQLIFRTFLPYEIHFASMGSLHTICLRDVQPRTNADRVSLHGPLGLCGPRPSSRGSGPLGPLGIRQLFTCVNHQCMLLVFNMCAKWLGTETCWASGGTL